MSIEAGKDEWRRAIECARSSGQVPDAVAQATLARIETDGALTLASDVVSSWLGLSVEPCERFLDLARTLDRIAVSPPRMTTPTLMEPPEDPDKTVPPALYKEPTPAAPTRKRGEWPPNVPHRLGAYDLEEVLGEGGMGLVFRARHTTLGTPCAVKVVTDARNRERFLTEAKSVAAMGKHPNIVSVYDLGEERGLPYYAMELVTGRPLAHELVDRQKRGRDYSSKEIARLLERVARAVHFAHQHNVIHRDLTPNNVIVREDGEPQVMDFGLARQMDVEERRSVVGVPMGTPHYMSPEQARGDVQGMNARTDVYGLGAILYEMLTRHPPHSGTPQQAFVHAVRGDDPPRPRTVVPTVCRDLETICLKALDVDSARRYPTANEFADDLRRHLDGEPITAAPIARVSRLLRKARRHKGVVIPSVVAVLLGLALLAWVWVPSLLEESHWKVVYSGVDPDRDFLLDWMPAVGLVGTWTQEGDQIVGACPSETAMLVLMRSISGDIRIEYEVLQETPPHDFGCFVSSDIRGWQYSDPQTRYGSGYFIGLGCEDGATVKVAGAQNDNIIHDLVVQPTRHLLGLPGWRRVKVQRDGNRIRTWVADEGMGYGEPLLDWPGEQTASGNGYCGLQLYQGTYRFRRIVVRARDALPARARLLAEVGRAGVEFDAGDYPAHQDRLRRVLADEALSQTPEAQTAVQHLLANTVPMVPLIPGAVDAREEQHLGMEAFVGHATKGGAYSLDWKSVVGEDPEPTIDFLRKLETRYPGDRERTRIRSNIVSILTEYGQYESALREWEGIGGPSSSTEHLFCLLGLGRRAEALRMTEHGSSWECLLAAEMGDDAPLGAFSWSLHPKPDAVLPAAFLVRRTERGIHPPAEVLVWDPPEGVFTDHNGFVAQGLLRGGEQDLKGVTDFWTRTCASLDLKPPKAIRLRVDTDSMEGIQSPLAAEFCRHLGGLDDKTDIERLPRTLGRGTRAWARLAIAIRKEADGKRDDALAEYKRCLEDCLGHEFPWQWADAAVRRLARE